MKRMYSPKVRNIAQFLGVKGTLKRVYESANLPHNEIQSFIIGDISIKVRVHTAHQAEFLLDYLDEERPVLKRLLDDLRSEDVFYDVGALYGAYSCLAAKTASDITVHAFEPGLKRQEWFRDTAEINDVSVNLHGVALSYEDGEMELTDTGSLTNSGGIEPVRVVNADRYIYENDLEPPSVVKIDVEGKELDVIKGMNDTILSHCRLLICEVHPHRGVDPDDVYETLQGIGFRIDTIETKRDGGEFIWARSGNS